MSDLSLPRPYRVALVGAGRVGTTVAMLLRRRGHSVIGIASRSEESAQRARSFLEAPVFELGSVFTQTADVVLIGASDAAIREVAGAIAHTLRRDTVVCHFSGSLGLDPLTPVSDMGAKPCALHPVAACPDVITALRRLPGSAWGITSEPDIEAWSLALVRDELEGFPVLLADDQRPAWHAAAVVAANGVASLLTIGEAILTSLGVSSPEAVLGPLASGAVANAVEGGGGAATLTGPAVRGEIETIERHLAALGRLGGDLAADYKQTARTILAGASRAGRLDPIVESRVMEALETE
jgi:predicted short-subunit dehydrogenase-like oxidoreductase (DUF2520 family)